MNFVAIDVETANADRGSICQVGIATYADGALVDEWVTLVDPEAYFHPGNMAVHGITPRMVAGAPTFAEVAAAIHARLAGQVTVSHSSFDRLAITTAFERCGLIPPEATWLDSVRVARRAWVDSTTGGYGLKNLCQMLGYRFGHHDALEDAKAAGHIMLAAAERTGLDLAGWLVRVEQPVAPPKPRPRPVAPTSNPDGPWFGEVLVLGGSLLTPRDRATTLAAHLGCTVAANVTRKTTIVVVPERSLRPHNFVEKCSKHRKAEDLVAKGQVICIVGEMNFRKMGE